MYLNETWLNTIAIIYGNYFYNNIYSGHSSGGIMALYTTSYYGEINIQNNLFYKNVYTCSHDESVQNEGESLCSGFFIPCVCLHIFYFVCM